MHDLVSTAAGKKPSRGVSFFKPSKDLKARFLRYWPLYLFILPSFIFVAIFNYGPMYGVQIAFRQFNPGLGITNSPWVGLMHFRNFFGSFFFQRVLRNTFILSFYSMIVGFPIPIIFALMLNELRWAKFKKVVQTIMYAPHFISMVVFVGMLTMMFSPSIGVVNHIIETFGGERRHFMTMPSVFRHMFVWSGVWQGMGWSAIIYIAALSTVDPELHEAAIIDGASRIRRMWHINIPCIMPTIIILLIMRLGSIANVNFERALLMQNDLNLEVSDVIQTFVYQRGIIRGQFSFAAAVGLFNNLVNVTMLLIANFIASKASEHSLF